MEHGRWTSGPIYPYAVGAQPSGQASKTYAYPEDPSREGAVWGSPINAFGNDTYYDLHRMQSIADQRWTRYAMTNPESGRSEPKSSYVIKIDGNGERAAVGDGIHGRDFPGACDPADVNAADLAMNPGAQRLQEFVRCAALQVESTGYFAGPVLTMHPRWNQGSIYLFGVNAETGHVEFSGNPASFGGVRSGFRKSCSWGGTRSRRAGCSGNRSGTTASTIRPQGRWSPRRHSHVGEGAGSSAAGRRRRLRAVEWQRQHAGWFHNRFRLGAMQSAAGEQVAVRRPGYGAGRRLFPGRPAVRPQPTRAVPWPLRCRPPSCSVTDRTPAGPLLGAAPQAGRGAGEPGPRAADPLAIPRAQRGGGPGWGSIRPPARR